MAIIHIPTLFKTCATAVNQTFSTRSSDPFMVYYSYGHYIEVLKMLTKKGKSINNKATKYPLIWLVMDFPEKYGPSINGYCRLPRIDILIVMPTKKDITTEERIEQNFIPRLYPIYEELLKQIANSILFRQQSVKELEHEKIDRPYWGMQDQLGNSEANLFNDYIDAIQIRGLQLDVNPAKCVA